MQFSVQMLNSSDGCWHCGPIYLSDSVGIPAAVAETRHCIASKGGFDFPNLLEGNHVLVPFDGSNSKCMGR